MILGVQEVFWKKKIKEEKARLGRKSFRSGADGIIAQPTQCGTLEQILTSGKCYIVQKWLGPTIHTLSVTGRGLLGKRWPQLECYSRA